jgi:hypothetical protein
MHQTLGWLYLNGRRCTNLNQQAYQGDVVAVWPAHAASVVHGKEVRAPRLQNLWPKPSATVAYVDNPTYVEVDELTYTISLLFEPMHWCTPLYFFKERQLFPFLTVKCYN